MMATSGSSIAKDRNECVEEAKEIIVPVLFYRAEENWEAAFDFLMNVGGSVQQAVTIMSTIFILMGDQPAEVVLEDFIQFCIDSDSVDS